MEGIGGVTHPLTPLFVPLAYSSLYVKQTSSWLFVLLAKIGLADHGAVCACAPGPSQSASPGDLTAAPEVGMPYLPGAWCTTFSL